MNRRNVFLIVSLLAFSSIALAQRDARLWPFASDSIWNMPIGSKAKYVPAGIGPATESGMTVDEDILIMTPDAPLTQVFENHADWKKGADRCRVDGPKIADLPMPKDFVTVSWRGLTPNHAAAVLLPDGRTIHQSQPFSRCGTGECAVTHYVSPNVDLYGDGIEGAHGGSMLSSVGGTIRLGELVPGGVMRHALKVNLFCSKNVSRNEDDTPGYRWPCRVDYGCADGRCGGTNRALEMGALLALKPDFDVESLETEPARILARAFMDYGAYVVDDTAWDVYALETEWSPTGRVLDEFKKAWGFDFEVEDLNDPWSKDMRTIFTNLCVIDNNSPGRIGGGGAPRQPLAPPLVKSSAGSEAAFRE
jgi:hypothetical protein